MKELKPQILEYVGRYGPTLPANVAKQFKLEILFAGAILSELVANKAVLVSNTKRGGSPFYYVKGQEHKLQEISQYLGGKPKEAYSLIKEKKLIMDSSAEPWQRVALREIKDYAKPINVKYGGDSELFWKWYLMDDGDVKKILGDVGSSKPEEDLKQGALEEVEEKVNEKAEEIKPEIESRFENKEAIEEKPVEIKEDKINVEGDYYSLVLDFFNKQQIYAISQSIVRKNREFNFIVDIPSGLGKLRYFVKFKNKKSISESDLIDAAEEASKKDFPILFLSNGDLNKKAERYLNENISGKLIFKNLNA